MPGSSSVVIQSPIGSMLGVESGGRVVALSFIGGGWRAERGGRAGEMARAAAPTPVLLRLRDWTRAYFAGENPHPDIPIAQSGTDFQREVWDIVCQIPYGETRTYGDMARLLEMKRDRRMAAQAVGQAVGANGVMLLVPCHRVLSAGGLGGYGSSGLKRKRFLLGLEKKSVGAKG
ncbi:MAG: methylated-DNA--[protein]-cysteine S-methyltransferase [Rickettsiales bacterium]|nr:methylated-DNA--[protein]-cysteine S-methyltransferase [Rickettsiales bacterium]